MRFANDFKEENLKVGILVLVSLKIRKIIYNPHTFAKALSSPLFALKFFARFKKSLL